MKVRDSSRGIALVVLGAIFFTIYLVATITNWREPSSVYLLLGIIFIGIGLYRILKKKDDRLIFKKTVLDSRHHLR